MKSFRLYKPVKIFRPRKNASGIQRGKVFEIFKKPVFLTIAIALVIGLIAGTFSSIYLAPLVNKWLGSKEAEDAHPDLFLEPDSFPLGGEEEETEEIKEKPESIADVVEMASPAVVSVIVSKYVSVIEEYYINPFEELEERYGRRFGFEVPQYREKGKELQEISGGTGFIVSSDGLVITNKHVVYDEDAEYTVLTNDGQKYSVQVLARDPIQDIAVLKIPVTDLPTVKLGDSDKLRIGQTVIAIGNALGEFRNTVSVGVISGLARSVIATGGGMSEQLEEVIQTDAAINRGNSGGPLLNLYGEVIGINTAIALDAENIGFAISINKVKKAIIDVQTKGKISYPFLGVRYILIDKTIQEKNDLPVDYGVWVVRGDKPGEVAVTPGSAADKAGIVENDIILEVDGKKITLKNTLAKIILKHSVGDKIILKVLRYGGEKIIEAELGELK